MRKNIIRYGVIVAVFVFAMVFFSIYLNQGTTDMTIEMKEATLPIAAVMLDEYQVNEMHGYVNKMDVSTIRDSLTPIGEDRALSLVVDKYSQEISGISFEVRSVDGERLIENTQITDYEDSGNKIKATIHIKDLIEQNTEYNFVLIIKMMDGREVYYYTRIIQSEDVKASEKINYVLDFHNKTFDKEEAKSLTTFLESNSEGDNSSFQKVTIHSSLDQVTWGNMKVKEVDTPSLTICEIGKQTASISLDYIVNVKEGKINNYYMVREFFRIRYTTERFYLLSYDRTMDEIFIMEKASFANNKIILGIQNQDSQMTESDGGNILAFVNLGRIYSYNVTENKMARLFAFFGEDNFDKRTTYNQSNVKILNLEENGNAFFMVYGYMNRGLHEGEVGAEICYYNSLLNTIEEQIFIPYDKSPKILTSDIQRLTYVNRGGMLFIYMDGDIYRINVNDQSVKKIVSGLTEETFFTSQSNKMIVWQKENLPNTSRSLTLMNLGSEQETDIDCKHSEYIKPIGFMNEDLIYGIADENDLVRNKLGDLLFPMNRVLIQAESKEILKDYHLDNIYVTSGMIEGNQINLTRMQRNENGSFIQTTDDQITNNEQNKDGTNYVSTVLTDVYETIHQIELKNVVDTKSIKFLTPKEVLYEGGRSVKIERESETQRYYVYAKGKLHGIYVNPNKAIKDAYANMGTVVDNWGNEVYKRGELSARNQIMAIKEEKVTQDKDSLTICLDTMLKFEGISRNTEFMLNKGENVGQILHENMKNADVIDLSGCALDIVLYYVNKDVPVLAYLNDGNAVLVIGFNEQNTVLMDPVTGTIYKKGINDSRAFFEENQNQFITYSVKKNLEDS